MTEVAARFGVSRQTLHAWLAKYEAGGLENLGDGSHRPRSCPHQMPAEVEVVLAEMRRAHPSWGPRRLVFELAKRGVERGAVGVGGVSGVGAVEPDRPGCAPAAGPQVAAVGAGTPMELWQMDVVGGFVLADGTKAKALTGVDDHSRFCVSAFVMPRESSRQVCDGLALAMRRWGVPGEILTDNGKVFTGRFNQPPVEVLFDRICRENGITHRLTQPRSPTTTGKIERFHRSCGPSSAPTGSFAELAAAQAELDEWVRRLQHEPATPGDRDGHRRPSGSGQQRRRR